MKVLLIEDNPNYAFLVEAMLRSSDHETLSFTWADGLGKGIEQLQQDPANVILLDLSLPDSDGLATLTALKTKAGTTPIIVLTGCNDEQLAIEAMRLGAQDYLLKTDIDKRGLLRALRYAIERRHSEDKYRELVESIDTIVWEADPVTWRFTFVSKAAEKILGYPVDHWLQASDFWVNLIHPDDRSATVDYCKRHIEQGDNHEFEYRVVALDGRVVWLRDIVRTIKNESGRPIILRGVMIDITQAKQAAAELARHHYEIQSLQEISQLVLEAAEPNTGIQTALEKSVTVGGFDFGDILLTTPQGDIISVAAACGFRDPASLQRTPRPEASTRRRTHLRQSSVVENIQTGDRFRSLKREGAETVVIVPLRAGNESLGLLQLASRSAKQIRANELALAEAMGRQIGIAIQKAKLIEELQTNLRLIKALYESNVAVNSTLDLRAVLDILLEKIDTFPFPGAAITIQLIDGDSGRLEYFANRNVDEQAWIGEFGSNRNISTGGLTKHAIESKTPIVIQDLRTDRRVHHPEFFHSQGLFSYLGVQVRIKERTVGVVGIYTRMPYEFSLDEINPITALASQAAVAIHNARLYTEVDKKSQELSALLDVTSSASRSLDMQQVLHDVAKQICQIFDFDATRILLFDQRKDELHLRASYKTREDFVDGPNIYPKGQGISGKVATTGEAIVIENIESDSRYERLTYARTALKNGQKFAASFPVKYKEEILGVITCFGRQPRQLTTHEFRLITSMSSQVAVAVTNARLYEQTKQQAEQLRNLATHLESVREQERTRIARELHDELGQALTGLKFDVAWINGKLSDSQSPLAGRLTTMSESLDNTIHAIRKISTRLRPDILDKLGLSAAIEWHLQEFRQRTGIKYHFACYPNDIRLSEQQSIALFRILQEALTNVARHSHASRVRIALEIENGDVFLRVDDDGRGIEEDKIFDRQSLGLLGMRERAASLGGNITIQRNDEQGTTVAAHLPIEYLNETMESSPRSEEL